MPATDDVCLITLPAPNSRWQAQPTVEAQPAEVALSLPDPAQQFNTGNCDRCGLESLKPEHRTDA